MSQAGEVDLQSRELTKRLFFALWPDEEQRAAFAHATHKAVRASGGRPIVAENLHVTLAFLGSVPESRVPDVLAVARRVAQAHVLTSAPQLVTDAQASPVEDAQAFPAGDPVLTVTFDRLEHWKKQQLLCALMSEPTQTVPSADGAAPVALAALAALAEALKTDLARAGLCPDLKPFRVHVTVARKVVRPTRSLHMHSVVWRFAEFALVESRTLEEGAIYSVIESFPLFKTQKA